MRETEIFDNATAHYLARRNEIDNVEINLIRRQLGLPTGSLELGYSLGARWFRFHEDLTFGARNASGTGFGGEGDDEAYLRDKVTNNLVGFQFGMEARQYLGYNLWLAATPKMGLFGNHIDNRFLAYNGDGVNATSTASGQRFPAASQDDVFSFLGEINVQLDWQFHANCTAFLGYRFLAMTGMALADSQFAAGEMADLAELATIDHNGDLILHGAFAGLEFQY